MFIAIYSALALGVLGSAYVKATRYPGAGAKHRRPGLASVRRPAPRIDVAAILAAPDWGHLAPTTLYPQMVGRPGAMRVVETLLPREPLTTIDHMPALRFNQTEVLDLHSPGWSI